MMWCPRLKLIKCQYIRQSQRQQQLRVPLCSSSVSSRIRSRGNELLRLRFPFHTAESSRTLSGRPLFDVLELLYGAVQTNAALSAEAGRRLRSFSRDCNAIRIQDAPRVSLRSDSTRSESNRFKRLTSRLEELEVLLYCICSWVSP